MGSGMIKVEKEIAACIEYILISEREDYYEWCEDNEYGPDAYINVGNLQHIYAVALMVQDELVNK